MLNQSATLCGHNKFLRVYNPRVGGGGDGWVVGDGGSGDIIGRG